MGKQRELIEDEVRQSLREKMLVRARGRKVTPREIAVETFDAGEIAHSELRDFAVNWLTKIAKDAFNEDDPATGVPGWEKLPGAEQHAQVEMFTYEDYAERIKELLSGTRKDIGRIRRRVVYARKRWGRAPRLPKWFTLAAGNTR